METKTGNLLDELLATITPIEQSKVDTKLILAAKIADGMKAKGWKSKDLLESIGKDSPSLVTKWLSGTHNFTSDTLVELENALGIQLINRFNQKSETVFVYHIMAESQSDKVCNPYLSLNDPKSIAETSQMFFSGQISGKPVLSKQNS